MRGGSGRASDFLGADVSGRVSATGAVTGGGGVVEPEAGVVEPEAGVFRTLASLFSDSISV